MNTNGLVYRDLKYFFDVLKRANDSQLIALKDHIRKELNDRHERAVISMAQGLADVQHEELLKNGGA